MMRRFFLFLKYGVVVLVLFVVGSNVWMYKTARPHLYTDIEALPQAQAILIPGAAILRNGDLSPIFRDRVEIALAVYKAGKASTILASGDNSKLEYNEVEPVQEYLIERGVPKEDIFLDHAGFDTYSSMYRARDVFQAQSVIVVTQWFHLPRAVFIGRTLGMTAYGMKADIGRPFFKNYVREVFANEKALIDLLLGRQPKFLGDPIPL